MGLCKCRVVTNLFCFDHRLNVCENCLVAEHPRCVIRSYLQWLQESEYQSACGICKQSLQEKELVRLTCYDVFHWECLDSHCRTLPPTTAPAGYVCPTCTTQIIPTKNSNSPVASALNEKLSMATWGKTSTHVPNLEMVNSSLEMNSYNASQVKNIRSSSSQYQQYASPPSGSASQSSIQISRDDANTGRRLTGLQTASWLTRWKRKLGIRPLALMGRDFTRLAILLLGIFCVYLLVQR
eukprot:CFRG0773T1